MNNEDNKKEEEKREEEIQISEIPEIKLEKTKEKNYLHMLFQ